MPEKETLERAEEDAREGKSPSTQAGEFVRRNAPYSRRQAWRCFHQASDCYRTVESSSSRGQAAAAQEGHGVSRDEEQSQSRSSEGKDPPEAIPQAVPCYPRSAQEQRQGCSFKEISGDPGAQRRQKARFGCSQTLRDEGRPDQGKSCSGRSQSRLNPRDLELKAPRSTTIGPPCSRSRRQSVYQKSQRQSRGRGPLDSHFSCIVRRGIEGSNLAMSAKANWPNAKLMFEAALADLDSDNVRLGGTGTVVLERARPLRAQTESVRLRRERALNEAAEALAKLWKR